MSNIDDLQVESAPRGWRVSGVWLVPLLALAIAVGVAWQNYANRGPLIEVAFPSATGVRSGETELRYRDIAVGQVEDIRFSDALDEVIVSIRLDQGIAPFVDDAARFWVVRPEVTTQGVSGLDTVLSGVYIEGDWDGTVGNVATRFVGLDAAPLLTGGQTGTSFVLTSDTSLPPAATPILYRGVQVGEVGEPRVAADGQTVQAEAVVFAPHDQRISTATRFWDVSGVSFSLGAAGASVDFSSLASLLAGGVAFDTFGSGGSAITPGREFQLLPDESTARQSFLIESETGGVEFLAVFDENLPGLTIGSAVQLGGVQVGEVTSIAGITDEARFGDGRVRLSATLRMVPSRIGFTASDDQDIDAAFLDFIERRVGEGLRARLANASILTPGLRVELVDDPGAGDASLDRTTDPFPQIPTIAPNVTDVTTTVQDLLQRVEALPVEDVLRSAVTFLDAASTLVASADTQAIPADVSATLDELRGTVASVRALVEADQIAAIPDTIASLSSSLSDTASRINAVVSDLQDAELVSELSRSISAIGDTAEALPGLADQASAVLNQAEQLSLQDLADRAQSLLASGEALLEQDSLRALPEELNATLADLRATLTALRDGGLVDNANAALASARGAAEAVAEASASLPELSARLNALAGQAGAALDDYAGDGQVGRDLTAALRQIEAAATSLDRLARQIARNPNSILTGR